MKRMVVVCLLGMASLLARAASDCRTVGGSTSTNFVNATTTSGTTTGDLAGSIGVSVLGITQGANGALIFHVQHTWVTTSGDTIFVKDAYITAYSSPIEGLLAGSYLDGVVITGGTGRFARATGKLSVWGAVNQTIGEVTLRYAGTVCFAEGD